MVSQKRLILIISTTALFAVIIWAILVNINQPASEEKVVFEQCIIGSLDESLYIQWLAERDVKICEKISDTYARSLCIARTDKDTSFCANTFVDNPELEEAKKLCVALVTENSELCGDNEFCLADLTQDESACNSGFLSADDVEACKNIASRNFEYDEKAAEEACNQVAQNFARGSG